MKIEWRVWNIHNDWQPLQATTKEEAVEELQRKMPYSEEAQIRINNKEIFDFIPANQNTTHWEP